MIYYTIPGVYFMCVCAGASEVVLVGQHLAARGGCDWLPFELQVASITCGPSGGLSAVHQSGEPANSPH